MTQKAKYKRRRRSKMNFNSQSKKVCESVNQFDEFLSSIMTEVEKQNEKY